MKHTKTPWRIVDRVSKNDKYHSYTIFTGDIPYDIDDFDGSDLLIADNKTYYNTAPNKEDAAFIVKAVNCHDELVELLTDILNHIQDGAQLHCGSLIFAEDSPASVVIKEALAKAKGDA